MSSSGKSVAAAKKSPLRTNKRAVSPVTTKGISKTSPRKGGSHSSPRVPQKKAETKVQTQKPRTGGEVKKVVSPRPKVSSPKSPTPKVRSGGVAQATVAEALKTVHDNMLKLWDDHVSWTYITVIEAFYGLAGITLEKVPEDLAAAYATLKRDDGKYKVGPLLPSALDSAYNRLQKNQDDFGALFGTFFGSKFGKAAAGLLHQHISQAVVIVVAMALGDKLTLNDFLERWYANGTKIADALTSVNPEFWPQTITRAALKKHLDTTVAYVTARFEKRYEDATDAYEEALAHMRGTANFLSAGIIQLNKKGTTAVPTKPTLKQRSAPPFSEEGMGMGQGTKSAPKPGEEGLIY